jgi:hypothetical protein
MPGFAGDPGDRATSLRCFRQLMGAVQAQERATGRSDATRPPGYHWFFAMEQRPARPTNRRICRAFMTFGSNVPKSLH